jgi:mannose-6-phosphate isomerase-like protein (cupin superfamily)
VTRGFLPGLKAGSPRYASDDRDARGADPHFHRTFSESFYVMDGTVRLFNGETWIDAVKGDFLDVPRGGIHAFPTRAVRQPGC